MQKTAGTPADLPWAQSGAPTPAATSFEDPPASLPAPRNELSYTSRAACSSCTEVKTKSNRLAEGQLLKKDVGRSRAHGARC